MIQIAWEDYGYLGALLLSLALNLIPFTSPSNLLLSAGFVVIIKNSNPLLVAIVVAIAATLAKGVHFYLGSLAGSKFKRAFLLKSGSIGSKLRRWGALGTFLAAASPFPDDAIVIPLGIIKYNASKFFVAYLSGKILTTTVGAYTGSYIELTAQSLFGREVNTLIGIVVFAFLLLLMIYEPDVEKIFLRLKNALYSFSKLKGGAST